MMDSRPINTLPKYAVDKPKESKPQRAVDLALSLLGFIPGLGACPCHRRCLSASHMVVTETPTLRRPQNPGPSRVFLRMHAELPRPGVKPEPQQQRGRILSPLCHQGTLSPTLSSQQFHLPSQPGGGGHSPTHPPPGTQTPGPPASVDTLVTIPAPREGHLDHLTQRTLQLPRP